MKTQQTWPGVDFSGRPISLAQLTDEDYQAWLADAAPFVARPREKWSLSLDDMVKRTGKTRRWLFTHADELPFVRRITRKTLRGDALLLERWIARR
jgi:hypothetical protein